MTKIPQKYQNIISLFLEKGTMQSSEAHAEVKKMGEDVALVTIKRATAHWLSVSYPLIKRVFSPTRGN